MSECSYRNVSQYGFTLLELLVVISLLAIVAGIAMTGYDNFQQQARYDATRYEMTQIRQAMLQFRRDSGTNDFPGQGSYDCDNNPDTETNILNPQIKNLPSYVTALSAPEQVAWCKHPANFWMLFSNPFDNPATSDNEGGWNIDTKRGWNGPYLKRSDSRKGVDSGFDGSGAGTGESGVETDNLWVINDAYGQAYLVFDLDDTDDANPARLVSLSENASYEGEDTFDCDAITASTDYPEDLVLCLLR